MTAPTESTISAELRDKVRAIIADVLEVDAAELSEANSFADDFEADSLMSIEMFSRFERDLGISIPQDELVDLDDLGTAYELVGRHSAAEATSV
ncbi:acyl carrier protein [Marinitenerispora sediminis]|uniref:Polyketide-8 synthase acyl carrier protein n=1 Tax=Marinitenerispora sediminis TaxID=1931232 RepID=A0A368T6V0_9ACTN|nr:acyl carrier protein [Marinitenerispora sediminis]RCV48309.1 polyketide-8 synthase acyl carrier protein [Marinitenerispora sediminis]RCV49425.1 polyketide-8 synthase acyl carrier protein [Marinitenerispora sediminis]RCV59230.1 polyketide-8 synthase acyl carrier protein [Marinitenerispora sediminis]